MNPEQTNVVELSSVSKRFKLGTTEVDALKEISLGIRKNDFAAITGPSGSGKSTLLNLIGCLDVPTSGEVKISGTRTSDLDEKALDKLRSRAIGFIFQSFNLIPVLKAVENVMLPLQLHGLKAQQMREQAEHALRQVGLEHYIDHLPDQLSGGQRQRVSIARALVTKPNLVLADEPTANLDSSNSEAIIELMRKLNKESGVTFVFSTHDASLLGKVDRIIRIRDGKLQEDTAAAPLKKALG
ncbi:ABC transporter ATP-binding protein [Stigmatella aurantiaca]|uniref:ABC transporter, ATP-binding protein n=1 Tax=Stigmatella aurantiaca (strain DW4/3-1) TaxID=378806 RepID=E3FWW9_STIAD|nr:ABC transporter ATP-binding protein [Stigmatella aurantiaca]ADO71020.1 ABC transporter, ATP-binding protein [Stigmatella aurantiaca DW4/3-1]